MSPRTPLCAVLLTILVVGCIPVAVDGLEPTEPRQTLGGLQVDYRWIPVDSLQPTLKWSRFTDESGRDVTYDLVVLRATDDLAEVYERTGLPDAEHTLETPLEPDTRYTWSVRARFTLDGRTRVTPWSTIENFQLPRRMARVPHPGFFRFRTP